MVKLFIDSDIILDLLLKRKDYESSAELMTRILDKKYAGFTTPIVIANIHYIMTRFTNKKKSLENIKKIRKILSILSVTEKIIDEALLQNAPDLEDSIQYLTATQNDIDFIITRNKKDYKLSKVRVFTAKEFLFMGTSKK